MNSGAYNQLPGEVPKYGNTNVAPPTYGNSNNTPTIVQQQPPRTDHFMSFGTTPVTINCHNCGQNITTSVVKKTGGMQWLACCICCIFGCDLGCCFIPFCIESLKDVTHSCPNCNIVLGKSKGGF